MPIQELVKFREKYPQYNDLDDVTLATKLAQKYPQYGDLVEKAKVGTPAEPKIFGVAGSVFKSEYEAGKRNILGNVFERPGAAVRGGILSVAKGENFGKGYERGALIPQEVPSFRSLAEEKSQRDVVETASRRTGILSPTRPVGRLLTEAEATLGGTTAAVAGTIGDILTNPADLIGILAGKLPGVEKAGKAILKSEPAQAVGRFLTKERGIPGAGKLQEINQAFKNVKDPVKFSKEVRSNLFAKKKEIGDTFEKGIRELSEANPTKTADLSDQFFQIKGAMNDSVNNPGLASDINGIIRRIKDPQKASFIKDLIDSPENARNLNLQQIQDIKTTIQQSPSIATKLKQGKFADWKAGDIELLDLIDEVKLAQSNLFPEEMADIRQAYGDYMSAYREVKNMFKPKVLLGKMKTGFGNEEIENMINVVISKDVAKQVGGFRALSKTKEAVKKGIVGGAVTGGVLYGLQQTGRKILGGK